MSVGLLNVVALSVVGPVTVILKFYIFVLKFEFEKTKIKNSMFPLLSDVSGGGRHRGKERIQILERTSGKVVKCLKT